MPSLGGATLLPECPARGETAAAGTRGTKCTLSFMANPSSTHGDKEGGAAQGWNLQVTAQSPFSLPSSAAPASLGSIQLSGGEMWCPEEVPVVPFILAGRLALSKQQEKEWPVDFNPSCCSTLRTQ